MEHINDSWLCDYITLRGNNCIKCRMCDSFYPIYRGIDHLKNHIFNKHEENYCYARILHGTNFKWKQYFYTIQNDNAKCKLCNKVYCHYETIMSPDIERHLKFRHNVDKYIAKALREWLHSYVSVNLEAGSVHFGEMQCRICNNIFQDSNSLNLMEHMRNIHQKDVLIIRQINTKRTGKFFKYMTNFFLLYV